MGKKQPRALFWGEEGRDLGLVGVRDHPDLGDFGPFDGIEELDEFLDGELAIGADDYGDIWLGEGEVEELDFEEGEFDGGAIEFDFGVAIDGDGLESVWVGGFGGGGGGGDDEIHAIFHEGGGDHEDDEENESEIEHGGDIEFAEGLEALTIGEAAHGVGRGGLLRGLAAGAMIHVLVFEFRGEFGGEVIEADDDPAESGDEVIVAEHGGDGDEEAGDRGDEGGADTWGHGGEVCGAGGGDIAEGFHHAPDCAEETEEGGTADGGGEDDHLGFEGEGGFADGAFHGAGDHAHLGRGDAWGGEEAIAESFVDFCGAEELESEFLATCLVDGEEGGTGEAEAIGIDAEGLAIGAKEGEELGAAALGLADDAEFGDHDRPAEDGGEEEGEEDESTWGGGLFEGEDEARATGASEESGKERSRHEEWWMNRGSVRKFKGKIGGKKRFPK